MLADDHPDRIQITFDDRSWWPCSYISSGHRWPMGCVNSCTYHQHGPGQGARGCGQIRAKMLTLVASALAGGDCIDDADVLRTGGTAQTLGCVVKAPSTLGTFLRSFRWGHVRQLDRVSRELLARAWSAGAGPGDAPFTSSRLEPTICETSGLAKFGARTTSTISRARRPYHRL